MPKARLKFKSGKAKRGAAPKKQPSSAPAPAFLTQASQSGAKRARSVASSASSEQAEKRLRSSDEATSTSSSAVSQPVAPSLPPSAYILEKDLQEYPTVDTSTCLPAESESAGLRFHKLVAGVCSAHAATARRVHADAPGLVDTIERSLGAMVVTASEAVAEHAQRQASLQADGRLRNPKNDQLRSRARVLRPLVGQYEAELEALERGAALAGAGGGDGDGEEEEEDVGMDEAVLGKYALAEEMPGIATQAAEDIELQSDAVRKGLRAVVAVSEEAEALSAKGRAALRQDFETLYPGASKPAALIKALAATAGGEEGAAASSSSSSAAAGGGRGEGVEAAADLARSLVRGDGGGGGEGED